MPLRYPRLYNGVRIVDRPCLPNAILIDQGAMPMIAEMNATGMLLDPARVRVMDAQLAVKQEEIQAVIDANVGYHLNANSGDQVGKLLFDDLKIHEKAGVKLEYTANGKYSTSADFLAGLRGLDPIVDKILEARQVSKLRSTYTGPLPTFMDADGRVRTTLKMDIARTGRLASADPNMQNVEPSIRSCFVAETGYELAGIDLAQIEMVYACDEANDTEMAQVFHNREDMHTKSACAVFQQDYERIRPLWQLYQNYDANGGDIDPNVLKEMKAFKVEKRLVSKPVGFGILYGVAAPGLVVQIISAGGPRVTIEEAEQFIDNWFGMFQGVHNWIRKQHSRALRFGMSWNRFGRMRLLPGAGSPVKSSVGEALRMSGNCVDYETEALTDRGWLRADQITMQDRFLTKNQQTGRLEWERPTHLSLFPDYTGPVTEFKHRSFSAVSTPEHRWLVNDKNGNVLTVTTADLNRNGEHRIHRSGDYRPSTKVTFTDAEVELFGWLLTDGNYKKNSNGRCTSVFICQSPTGNPAKCARIQTVSERSGHPFTAKFRVDHESTWRFGGEFAQTVMRLCPQRVLTMEFLQLLTREQLDLLREVMILGDGHTEPFKERFHCRDAHRAGMFQALCAMTGNASVYVARDMSKYTPKSSKMKNVPKMGTYYVVTVLRRHTAQVLGRQRFDRQGNGVWCPTFKESNDAWVCRRANMVYVTKNTPIQSGSGDHLKIAMAEIYNVLVPYYRWKYGQDCIRCCLQIHDELIFEGFKGDLIRQFAGDVQLIMQTAVPMANGVPVKSSAGFAMDWGGLK